MKLRIELESPLCAGSGLSRPAGADRDVVFDAWGLPWIPSRRLKGVWRDAYRDVRRMLGEAGNALASEDDLFGRTGAKQRGSLAIGNAWLENYEQLRPWFERFVAGRRGPDRRAFVMEAFSSLRRQTAMDRQTGAPKEETLRSTRILHPGLVFELAVRGDLNDTARWSLALAAAALREMGSSRWRGLGRVQCALFEGTENRTKAALEALTADRFQPGPWVANSAVVERGQTAGPATSRNGTLPFSLRLEEPALFPQLSGDPNTVSTAPYVPGTAVHGWFANRFLRGNPGGADDRFRELFTSGRVQFGNAYFAEPAPHSIRVSKSDARHAVDLSRTEAANVRRGRRWLDRTKLDAGEVVWKEPGRELHYHHARASDSRLQRAVGPEQAAEFGLQPSQCGAFFQYESLARGQQFHGEIRGEAADLQQISDLIGDGDRLELGRSKSAQYGGQAEWTWASGAASTAPGVAGCELTIVALAPVLGYSKNGHPAACFPMGELEAELSVELEPIQEFCRTEWHGGYRSHQLLPKSQAPGWAIGSVLVVRSKDGRAIGSAAIQRAAARSYGRRVELGFGRVRLTAGHGATTAHALHLPEEALDMLVTTPAGGGVTGEMAARIFAAQTEGVAKRAGQELASYNASGIPPK